MQMVKFGLFGNNEQHASIRVTWPFLFAPDHENRQMFAKQAGKQSCEAATEGFRRCGVSQILSRLLFFLRSLLRSFLTL